MLRAIQVPFVSLRLGVALLAFCLAIPAALSSDDEPDMKGILSLAGRFNVAHACPVSPDWALTAAHITDPRPFDPKAALIPYRFENGYGETGIAAPQSVYRASDLGWVRLTNLVTRFYSYGPKPVRGDRVYWVNFKDNRDNFHEDDVKSAEVQTIRAGAIYTKGDTVEGGASGGCVLNEDGKLVGIVSAIWTNKSNRKIGGFEGVFAPWTPIIPEVKDD